MKARWPTSLRWRVAAVAGVCLVGLVVAAAVLQTTTSDLPKRTGIRFIAPPLTEPAIVETLKLPSFGPAGSETPVMVTNGDLPDLNQPLQAVQSLPDGRLVVHSMRFDDIPLKHPAIGKVPVLPDATVQGKPDLGPPGQTSFDVSRFRSSDVLVAARQLRNGSLRVTVLALRQGLPRLRTAVVPTPPPAGARTVAVATWDAPAPDLFVIDRGAARVPVAVRIYSGESGFRKLLLGVRLPIVEPDPRRSLFDVARIQGGKRPDLVLVKRRGPLDEPEVHVLVGDTFFSTFDQHLAVPAHSISPGDQVVIGTRVGQVTAYIVSLGRGCPDGGPDVASLPRFCAFLAGDVGEPTAPALSVVVTTHSRRDLLGDCLDSARQAAGSLSEGVELLVVDDGRQGGIGELVESRFPGASLVTTAGNMGFASAAMEGIRRTRGDWIALLNDDVTVEPDTFTWMLQAARSAPDIGSVATQMRFADRPGTINSAGIEIDALVTPCDRLVGTPIGTSEAEIVEVFGASAGAALYRRAMLDEIGGFDVSFFAYLDDVDLAWRARMFGWRCLYAPQAVVYHLHSATFGHHSALKHYLTGRNRVRLVAKNADAAHLRRSRAGDGAVRPRLRRVRRRARAHPSACPWTAAGAERMANLPGRRSSLPPPRAARGQADAARGARPRPGVAARDGGLSTGPLDLTAGPLCPHAVPRS